MNFRLSGRYNPAVDDKNDSQPQIITSKIEILAILYRLVTNRVFVSVFLPGSTKEYTSTVLDVSADSHTIRLDQLYPADGDRRLRSAPDLRLEARVNGAELAFTTRVTRVGKDDDDLAYYEAAFPSQLSYLQRREHHRVSADRLEDITVELTASSEPDAIPVAGVLHDISGGGFSLWLRREAAEALEPWERIDTCRILFEDDPLEALIEIRGGRFVEEKNRFILGGQFTSEDPRVIQRIKRIVANLERKVVRRKKASPYV